MSKLTILGNAAITSLLLNLSAEEITQFQDRIKDCLIALSCEGERQYQPHPGIINRPNDQKILFRPFTSPTALRTKIVVHPAPISAQQDAKPQHEGSAAPDGNSKTQLPLNGVMVLCNSQGIATGLLNAEEVTGYRTSLNALIPYVWRRHTANIIIFGAGKQALWHSRLALALRGQEIKSITIVNRSEERASKLIQTLREDNESRWKSPCEFKFLNSSSSEDGEKLQALLSTADVIFCTLPSKQPLFSLASLKLDERQKRYPLITAVGSWQADMTELDPELLRHAVNTDARDGLAQTVLADDAENALLHAGEFVQTGLKRSEIVEIGEILLEKRNGSLGKDMATWLEEGLVVYKSIGVSVTDLAAGEAIMALAEKRGVGTLVSDF